MRSTGRARNNGIRRRTGRAGKGAKNYSVDTPVWLLFLFMVLKR
jgi:hypothetical protein